MSSRARRVEHFLSLHVPGAPLLLPNPWDAGSARVLASLGYRALATTSSGFAGTLGREDGSVTREEALAHARALCSATALPVSADLEQGYADTPEGVAETMRRAAQTGLAGCSVEDWSGGDDAAIYDVATAAERIAAAGAVTRAPETRMVLTARAENYVRGRFDLDDTIARLRAYVEAGADCVHAPGLSDLAEIERVVREVDAPVNVLLRPGGPDVRALAGAGVARISVGGAFYYATVAALATAGRELLEDGTHAFLEQSAQGRAVCLAALGAEPA